MSTTAQMKSSNRPSTMVFVDPYWLGSETGAVSRETLGKLLRSVNQHHSVERVYVYLESGQTPGLQGVAAPVTVRPCADDGLEDGFELIRSMDRDLQQLAEARACNCMVVVSMDDRLALSIERTKSLGIRVVGVGRDTLQDAQGTMKRMGLVFDQVLHVDGVQGSARANRDDDAPTVSNVIEAPGTELLQASLEAIESVVLQWFDESDDIAKDAAIEFINSRKGLPKHVDSRLLFLCGKMLGRDLTEPEKIALRSRFRAVAHERFGANVV